MFFKENFKILRKNNNLSQEEMGKRLNLTRDSIASLENGRMKPSIEILIKIKENFIVNIDDLIFKDYTKID